MANRHFVFFEIWAVRKLWWKYNHLPFVFSKHFFLAKESFYRPLVHSNLSFIFTETFRWLIFYTVNYRRQSIEGELAISNGISLSGKLTVSRTWTCNIKRQIIIRQADCFKNVTFCPSLIECKGTTFFRCPFLLNTQFFDKKWLNSKFFSIS